MNSAPVFRPLPSRRSLPLIAIFLAILRQVLAAASPLVISSGPLVPETDGGRSRGMPRVEQITDAGEGAWLAVWNHTALPDAGPEGSSGRIMARLLKAKVDGTPDLGAGTSFPPVEIADGLASNNQLRAVRGTGGAWAVWQSPTAVLATWLSATTGKPVGEPLVLGVGSSSGTVHTAGDGTTAWVAWAPGYFNGVLQGVTLSAQDGPARITGRFTLAGLTGFNNGYALTAQGGRALVTDVGLPEGATHHSTRTHLIGPAGEIINGPHVLTGPTPDRADNLYGVLTFGSDWMIVWAQSLTPALPGRIVYGRVLAPDGTAAADMPIKALFVEPQGAMSVRGVASADGVGVIAMARELTEFTFAQAVVLRPGQDLTVVQLGQIQPYRYVFPEPPLGLGFSGTRLAMLTPNGRWGSPPMYFVQELTLADTTAPIGRWPVSRGSGVQEEPAVAWMPGRSVVAWQQISTATSLPEVVVRQRGLHGETVAPDITIPRPPSGWLSSPAIAANGNRLLLVARRDVGASPLVGVDDTDDVVGVFLENDLPVTQPFLIAGGPGSQRAARVAAWGDGFCVAWREEVVGPTLEILYRIRATFLNRDGTLVTPNGLTLAVSVEELSSPTLATQDTFVAIAWRNLQSGRSAIEAVTLVGTAPDVAATAAIFGEPYYARSPDVIWDGGTFLFSARLRDQAADGDSLGLAQLPLGGIRATLLPTIDLDGREPALASLGAAGTALLWLDQRNGADATSLWMAVRETSGLTSSPQRVLQGRYDRDTLIARGDGRGRVMVAVHSNAFRDEGVRVFILAPGVTEIPAVENLQVLTDTAAGPWPGFAFRWKPNVLFPALRQTVEASFNLSHWDIVPEGLGEVTAIASNPNPEAAFRTVSRLPNPQPAAPFYRLRAVQAE